MLLPLFAASIAVTASAAASSAVTASATPTPQQLSFADQEVSIFMHFGLCTFADCEHNSGDASKFPPSLFAPTALDTDQVPSPLPCPSPHPSQSD